MAKRFTDTGKWDKAWFRKLTPKMKCVWMFFCDRCDHAGIWEIDEDAFGYFIGDDLSLNEVLSTFSDKIQRIKTNKIFIPGFVDFQYGSLNPSNRVHKSILDRVKKEGAYKGLIRSLKGSMEEEEDKEMVKRGSGGKTEIHPLAKIWNENVGAEFSKVKKSNTKRNKKIETVFSENTPEEWAEIVRRISRSSFCSGKNDKGWVADFDWLIQPETHLKVSEGKYDDRGGKSETGGYN